MGLTVRPLGSRAYWAGVTERAVKTFAQAVLAMLGGNVLGVVVVDWVAVGSVALLAAVASVMTSVASAPMSVAGSPSVVDDRPADRP
jgi:hypothetical protein